MNYRKSILSIVTAMALANSAMADTTATYLPLTNTTNDNSWILFGVNDFSNGEPSNAVSGPTSFSSGLVESAEDVATDNNATDIYDMGGGKYLASLQGLDESDLTHVKVGINTSGITYSETEPVRSMYIKVNDTDPNVKLNYKASLEGKYMEIIVNQSTTDIYNVYISEESTWNNAAIAGTEPVDTTGPDDDLKSIALVLDGNSTNNPINASNWDKTVHYTTADNDTNNTATFYKFDALSQQWKIFKNDNTGSANDFTEFEKGSAYWGRVDLSSNNVNDADGATNLILGNPSATNQSQLAASYLDDSNNTKLADGWNMLAFDDLFPYVRHAATGLVLTSISADDNLTITDDSGVYSTPDITLAGGGTAADATLINTSIESAKLRGVLPKSFNIKAFANSVANSLVLISDTKFTVGSDGGIAVKTLHNLDPYQAGDQVTIGDLSTDGNATSAYGEYAVMLNVLYDTGANSMLADHISKVQFGDSLLSDHTAINITQAGKDVADVVAELGANNADLVPTVTAIDTNFDGNANMFIVANETPFYVRDATYSRTFTTTTTGVGGIDGAYTISGTTAVAVTPVADDNASDFNISINGQKAATGVYAGVVGNPVTSTTLVVASTVASTFELKDTVSTTADYFKTSDNTDVLAQGAVSGVYSLDALASRPVTQYSFSTVFSGCAQPEENNNTLDINITTAVNLDNEAIAAESNVTTTAGRLAYFDGIVKSINDAITAGNLHGYASHDYTTDVDSFDTTRLTVEGVDMSGFAITEGNVTTAGALPIVPAAAATDANAATATTLGALSGDLAGNLKFNAVYTPNYANYGPLYTMHDAGFDVKGMLRAMTDITDSSIAWDSIDITRDEDDWFIQNEFNLFNVNLESGYWVYLAEKTDANITIGQATFTPTYSYYFDNDLVTTNNVVVGQLRVNIDGLLSSTADIAGTTSNVYAIIGGEEVQMKLNTGTEYTADVTKFESLYFKENGDPVSITIRATNGKGMASKSTDNVEFDYDKPATPTVAYPNASSAIFTTTSTDAEKFYVYDGGIPEIDSARTTALIESIDVTAGSGSSNICSKFTFGVLNTLRVVTADGDDGSANISDALQVKYTTFFKGSSVITHFSDGTTDKSQLAKVYDATCTEAATQPTGTENSGVSIKALISNKEAVIAYVAIANTEFDTNVAWDSIYKIGTTEVVQLQNTDAYAGKTFLIEYEDTLYTSTFPANQAQADAGTDARFTLTEVSSDNTDLNPL